MTLSIITINRNNKEGLRKTIQSVVSQTGNDFEYIIIDGASTDGSVDIIKEYAEHPEYGKKITYWVSEKDSGIYNAMNKGINLAKGKYLHMLNSGDWYESDALNNIIPTLKEENLDALLCSMNFWKNGNKIQSEIRYKDKLLSGSMSHQGIIYEKEIHSIVGLYDEQYKFAADYDFCIKAFLNKELRYSCIYIPYINFIGGGVGDSSKSIEEFYNIQVKYGLKFLQPKVTLKKIIKCFIPYGFFVLIKKIKTLLK